MIVTTNNLKSFIKKYDIANPNWINIPAGFPNCDISYLNNQEKIIWDAIYLAWINEHPIDYFGQKIANGTIISIAFLFVSTIFVSFLYYADVNYNLGLKFLTDFFA